MRWKPRSDASAIDALACASVPAGFSCLRWSRGACGPLRWRRRQASFLTDQPSSNRIIQTWRQIMQSTSTPRVHRDFHVIRRSARAGLAALAIVGFSSAALAADKPPVVPDTVAPFSTDSRIAATIEFGLPALAADIERDIPRRLASIDERVSCVHRRVLFFRINANCDVWGYVERSGPVSLYGRGDRVYGSTPIYGALDGQGANRFTARIHGETEASATVEVEARPQLTRDWSLDLNFSDGFHWSEPPVLHVMGREIPLTNY